MRRSWLVLLVFWLGAAGCASTVNTRPLPLSTDNPELVGAAEGAEDAESAERLRNLPAATHLERGATALRQGSLPIAKLHFSMAVAKDPELIDAYLGLGHTSFREGQLAAAKAAFAKVLEKDAEHVPALLALGTVFRHEGSYEEALTHLRRGSALQPDNPLLLTEMAQACEGLGQDAEAEAYYRQVITLTPRVAGAYNNLGFNLLLQEKYPEAVRVLEQGLSLAPDNRRLMNNLALAYALHGDARRALQLFEQSLGKAAAYNNLGYLLMVQGFFKDAELALNRALESNPVYYVRARENLDQVRYRAGEGRSLFD